GALSPELVEGSKGNRRADRTKGAAAPSPRRGRVPGVSPADVGLYSLSAGVAEFEKIIRYY
ncbi:MAG: hypothetical protein RMJ55_20340, partial [Roseiflexaceae bacterium]|nr:hypothetical protein [Roseiflexaceae bacterium]